VLCSDFREEYFSESTLSENAKKVEFFQAETVVCELLSVRDLIYLENMEWSVSRDEEMLWLGIFFIKF